MNDEAKLTNETQPQPSISPKQMLTEPEGGGKNAIGVAVAAVLIAVAAMGFYLYLGQKPPVAVGEISKVWVYSVHTKSRLFQGRGSSGDAIPFDQVLVVAKAKITNQSKGPIFLWNMTSTFHRDGGEVEESAAGPTDFKRAFIAYPKLSRIQGEPLIRETTIAPGESVEGLILTHYTMTKEEWTQNKGLSYTIGLRYQKNLVLSAPRKFEIIE